MSKEDLLEEIEILKGYKLMYHNLSKQNKRYREAMKEALKIAKGNVLSSSACSDIEVILNEALEGSE